MAFSVEDKHFIKGLRESKKYSSRRLLKEFPDRRFGISTKTTFTLPGPHDTDDIFKVMCVKGQGHGQHFLPKMQFSGGGN